MQTVNLHKSSLTIGTALVLIAVTSTIGYVTGLVLANFMAEIISRNLTRLA
jgi:hypothetical protein